MSTLATSRRQILIASLGMFFSAVTICPALLAQSSDESTDESPNQPSSEASPTAHQPGYGTVKPFDWQFGMTLRTPVTFTGGLATFPIPMDWPEQTVMISSRDVSGSVTDLQMRDLPGGARQAVVGIARMTANSSAEVLLNYKIEKRDITAPTDTDSLVIPPRVARELQLYLGTSPMIDARHGKIRALSRELEIAATDDTSAWQTVRRIYERVRSEVKYIEGPIRNASEALSDGKGDCEDMTSLFVALCRNAGVPARMVWIPGHCYPEFYLEQRDSDSGSGSWYPCQAAGTEQFGEMQEDRPILQKGDRFKVPEQRQTVRYVSEFFRCDRAGKGNPVITFIREPK